MYLKLMISIRFNYRLTYRIKGDIAKIDNKLRKRKKQTTRNLYIDCRKYILLRIEVRLTERSWRQLGYYTLGICIWWAWVRTVCRIRNLLSKIWSLRWYEGDKVDCGWRGGVTGYNLWRDPCKNPITADNRFLAPLSKLNSTLQIGLLFVFDGIIVRSQEKFDGFYEKQDL